MNSDFLLKYFKPNPQLGFVCAFFSDRNRVDLEKIAHKMPQNSAFIFREYDLSHQKRQELAEKIFAICKEKSCKFLIGKDLELARKIGADGVHFSDLDFVDEADFKSVGVGFILPQLAKSHLSAGRHMGPPLQNRFTGEHINSPLQNAAHPAGARRPLPLANEISQVVGGQTQSPRKFIISLSCHSLQSVQKAQNSGADVIFLSPIFATKSHANAKTLDLKNLEEACKLSSKPIFALGGISQENLASIVKCGSRGFGGIDIFN